MAKMTVEEVKKYAMKNYNNGGDAIVECWEDKDIQHFLDTTANPKKALDRMFSVRNEEFEAARYFSGYDESLEQAEETEEEDKDDDFFEDEEHYCPSTTNHDYSPSNPWDAPGMSIRDFI